MARHDTRFPPDFGSRAVPAQRCFRAFVAALAWLLTIGSARAYDEQASLDLALGYALTVQDDVIAQGASVDLGVSLGLSEAVVARATLGYAALVGPDSYGEREAAHLGRLRVEGLYLLDVLKLVPFFGLGVTLTNSPQNSAALPVRPGGHLLLGADYLVSRSWIVGVDVRSALLFEGDGHRVAGTDVALRVSRMFETF
jgi:hypothetical protein